MQIAEDEKNVFLTYLKRDRSTFSQKLIKKPP